MNSDFEEMFGPIVGQGAQATVYAKGEYAVKLYREGYPKINVFSEAFIMANLELMDFPGPKVYEVLLVNGQYGLRMDRVKGKLMSEGLSESDLVKSQETMNTLVELQCHLHSYDSSAWASNLKQRFHRDLELSARLPTDLKKKLQEELGRLPDGQSLCHCDFHAGNIFFDGEKYMIIDLLQISSGDPAADAACSFVSYSFADNDLAELYLGTYCEKS
ncbi:MAG: aminoglycoside phosphotransferase family protein, partial [Euryarchaeota archaeon]|nr:aminoglycoside phosphotransferase family protein [Euryarchaeota archaeon]